MPVTFKTTNTEQPPSASFNDYQKIIALAVDASRPFGEQWFVTTQEIVHATLIRFDFARGTDAPHSLSVAMYGDDVEYTALYRIVCHFLRRKWPGGIKPS